MGTNVDKGLPLFEAVRTYSDPASWATLESLLPIGLDPPERDKWTPHDWPRHDFKIMLQLGFVLRGQSSTFRTKNFEAWLQWGALSTAFLKRLQSGELVATGYVASPKLDDPRRTIPADKWAFLKPDFLNSTASGGGVEVVHVLVHPPGFDASAMSPDPYRTGLPGKPSIKHLILGEFRRRATADEVQPTLAAEARALHEWAKREHTQAPTPTPRTIQNHIRLEYWRRKPKEPTK